MSPVLHRVYGIFSLSLKNRCATSIIYFYVAENLGLLVSSNSQKQAITICEHIFLCSVTQVSFAHDSLTLGVGDAISFTFPMRFFGLKRERGHSRLRRKEKGVVYSSRGEQESDIHVCSYPLVSGVRLSRNFR